MSNIVLSIICGTELWAGFYGIDEYGTWPECDAIITEEVDEDSLEVDADGTMRPCYSVRCPKCGTLLEWPHPWEVAEELWPQEDGA